MLKVEHFHWKKKKRGLALSDGSRSLGSQDPKHQTCGSPPMPTGPESLGVRLVLTSAPDDASYSLKSEPHW